MGSTYTPQPSVVAKAMGDERTTRARGGYSGVSIVHKFGGGKVDATERTLRGDAAAASYTYPSSALSLTVVSTSADDDGAGTGARTVLVSGLDANFDVQEETVTLDGTTAVSVPGTWIRIHDMKVVTQGTYAQVGTANVGTITLDGGGQTHATILPGAGHSSIAAYTIPAGHTGCIHEMSTYVDGQKEVTISLYIRQAADQSDSGLNRIFHAINITGTTSLDSVFPEGAPEKSDLIWTASNGVSADVEVRFTLEVLQD